MALTFAKRVQAYHGGFWRCLLLAVPGIGILLAGCANTCFTFTSNPPTGTINVKASDPNPTCTLTTPKGTVHVVTEAGSVCSSCLGSHQLRHIFISLRGIGVRPGDGADDALRDWWELMPPFASQPRQIDLMGGAEGQSARLLLGNSVAIPAGAYRRVRLQFVPNQPTAEEALPEPNACHGAGFNCVVWEDGRIQPLLLDSVAPELRITSERIAGGSLLVLPDATSNLVLDFRVSLALSSAEGQGVQVLPALRSAAFLNSQSAE